MLDADGHHGQQTSTQVGVQQVGECAAERAAEYPAQGEEYSEHWLIEQAPDQPRGHKVQGQDVCRAMKTRGATQHKHSN